MLLLNKVVDQSVLRQGFSIPAKHQEEFLRNLGMEAPRGQYILLLMELGDRLYPVDLINQPFSREDYPDHTPVLQIRYSPDDDFPTALRELFHHTADRIADLTAAGESTRVSKWPEEDREYLALYSSADPGVIRCIPVIYRQKP